MAMASIANCWHNQRLLIWKITKRPPGVLPTTQLCLGETCPRFFARKSWREKWTRMGKYCKSIHVVSHVHGKNIGNRWNCCGFVLQIAMTYQTFSGKIVRKLWWTLMNHLYTSPPKKVWRSWHLQDPWKCHCRWWWWWCWSWWRRWWWTRRELKWQCYH